jgi:hypothetical protein
MYPKFINKWQIYSKVNFMTAILVNFLLRDKDPQNTCQNLAVALLWQFGTLQLTNMCRDISEIIRKKPVILNYLLYELSILIIIVNILWYK